MKDWRWFNWSNVGLVVITIIFIKWQWQMVVPSELLLLSYQLITVYPKLLSKFLSLRFGQVGNIGAADIKEKEKKDEKL